MKIIRTTKSRLRAAQRDLRVTADGIQRAYRLTLGGTGGFAQAIMRRYDGRRLYRPYLALVFRQSRPGITVRRASHHTQIHVTPHIELTVLNWRPSVTTTDVTTVPQPGLQLKRQAEIYLVQRNLVRLAEPPQIEQLVRRLAARGERSESVADKRVSAVPRRRLAPGTGAGIREEAPLIPIVPPVPKVVRRPTPALSSVEERPPVPGIQYSLAHAKPQAASGNPHIAAPEAIDVNRLTDQVIQAIDRRIIAQRERLGRV